MRYMLHEILHALARSISIRDVEMLLVRARGAWGLGPWGRHYSLYYYYYKKKKMFFINLYGI